MVYGRTLVAAVWLTLVCSFVTLFGPDPTYLRGTDEPDAVAAATFPFPADAQLVVSVRSLEALRRNLEALATAAVPKQAEQWKNRLNDSIKNLLQGRSADAIRDNARIFLVIDDLEELSEDEQAFQLLLPVTSYAEFFRTFLTPAEQRTRTREAERIEAAKMRFAADAEEQAVYFVDLGEYVAACLTRAAAERYTGKYPPGSSTAMGTAGAAAFLQADVAVFVNMAAVVKRHGEMIRALRGLVEFALQQAIQEGMLPQLHARDAEAVKTVVHGLFQGITDSQAIVLALEFGSGGVGGRLHWQFAENSPSARWLATIRATESPELDRLPDGMMLYSHIANIGPLQELYSFGLKGDFAAAADDLPGQRLLQQHLQDLLDARLLTEHSATAPPHSSLTISRYRDPQKALRAWVKIYKVLGTGGQANGQKLQAPPRVREQAETHRNIVFTEIRLHYDISESFEDVELPQKERDAAVKYLEKIFSQRTGLWLGIHNDQLIQIEAQDWKAARRLLDRWLDNQQPLGKQPDFALIRRHLGDKPPICTIVDTAKLLRVLHLFGELMHLLQQEEAAPLRRLAVPDSAAPALAGVSLQIEDGAVHLRLTLSPRAIGTLAQAVEPLVRPMD